MWPFFGVNDGHDDLTKETQADEPLLVVSEPIVFVGIRHTIEHVLGVDEVEAMLSEISPPFRLIPRDH